ncbi:unnamed protein product, partial [Didymodactylos carnosus]
DTWDLKSIQRALFARLDKASGSWTDEDNINNMHDTTAIGVLGKEDNKEYDDNNDGTQYSKDYDGSDSETY